MKFFTVTEQKSSHWLPEILVVLWLAFLGITIWQHVLHSAQPPVYDPIGYIQKAINFRGAVCKGKLFNPLNLEPTSRPPGTILMSYPFGFTPDYHGFHFRSVFLPILSIVAAIYITTGTLRTRANCWWLAFISLMFSSLPMFYQFDWIEGQSGPTRWGLVDNFHAGISAMAAAAVVRSLLTRSQAWLFCGAIMAAFTLLIKPSGLMVMLLLAMTWGMIVFFEWLQLLRLKSYDSSLKPYALKGSMYIITVYVCVAVPCFFSEYLSSANFAFAKQALATLRGISQIDSYQFMLLFHQSSGEALILWLTGVGIFSIFWLRREWKSSVVDALRVSGLMVGSFFIWIPGTWYWLVVQEGVTQVRYFYPFMLMGAVCMIPAALCMWPHISRQIRIVFIAICVIPALNIAMLLAAGDTPSITWQRASGVCVSVGTDREVVRQAYTFLDVLRKTNQKVQVYSFSSGTPAQIFENVGMYESSARPGLTSFYPVIPIDWVRGFVVRLEDLKGSDYLLIQKYGDKNAADLLATEKIDTFDIEVKIFELWLASLKENSGVETVSDGSTLRLLHIADRSAFNQAVNAFVATRSWRPEFVTANKVVPASSR